MPGINAFLRSVRERIKQNGLADNTARAYTHAIRRYIRFHGNRHPDMLGHKDVRSFLTHLAADRHPAASTQNQALDALRFLYKHVLAKPFPQAEPLSRARAPRRLPVILRRDQVRLLLAHLPEQERLLAGLLYGAGLRLTECLHLQVRDLDLDAQEITIRAQGPSVPKACTRRDAQSCPAPCSIPWAVTSTRYI